MIILGVSQRPTSKGKGILDYKESKLFFREQIKEQLNNLNIKPFVNDEKLVLKISFFTTTKNKFLLHNLVKNYLDLLHKPLYSRKTKSFLDKLDGLLFTDDSQIKILVTEKIKSETNNIFIQVGTISDFQKQIDYKIRNTEENNRQTNEDYYFGEMKSYKELKETNKNNTFRRFQLLSSAQKEYLYKSQLNLNDFHYFLLPEIPKYKVLKNPESINIGKFKFKGASDKFTAFNRLKDLSHLLMGFDCLDFKRTNTQLRNELKNLLNKFKQENEFLFPFVTPITLTVVLMQSKNQVLKDADNLIREFFIKNINSTLRAPEKPIVPYFELSNSTLKKRKGVINKYQVIEIEYDSINMDEKNGWIGFYLGDIYLFKDIFEMVEK